MPSLSFEKSKGSRPIAWVKGGDMNGEVLYLQEELGKPKKQEIPAHKYAAQLKKWKKTEQPVVIAKIQAALDEDKEIDPSEPEDIKELYKRIKEDRVQQHEVELPHDSQFQLIPNPDKSKRTIAYVVGASGSGKSHIARMIAEAYRQLFPDRHIILVSKLSQDDTLDNMMGGPPSRLNIPSLLEEEPDIEDFRDCLVIVDDVDALPKKELDAVNTLVNDIAITGRHTNTSMLYLSHHITNYSKTRLILNEATCYVVYPQTTSRHALKYLLETHVGLDKENIKKLRQMGRWVCIQKNIPPYVIGAHSCFLANQE